MSSAIFFKFKSQREPQRITFDGTHLSVFELKREIIRASNLGDGSDFDLAIYHDDDSNNEYDDDTAIIPRSTTVIARRLPPIKPGQGRAARYVSGRMPTSARTTHRVELNSTNKQGRPAGASAMQKAQTEEEKIAAMLQMDGDQWEEQQKQMANATAVYRPGGAKGGKPVNIPDHPPPPEYVCYRCGVKGHWIQACPTNNDPKFDGRPRVVRTVGIPRSFLQAVEKKPVEDVEEGFTDESRQPASRWVDSEGNAVAAIADTASWEQFQAKAQASAKQADVVASGSKELRERGLECEIDKRMFVDPMKTSCCGKTYCHECIETALINSDLVCPGCETEGVLLDNLVPDDDMVAKIKTYEAEKKAEKKAAENERANTDAATPPNGTRQSKSPTPNGTDRPSSRSPPSSNSKKRPAEDDLVNDRKPNAPGSAPTPSDATAIVKTTSAPGTTHPNQPAKNTPQPTAGFDPTFIEQMNALAGPIAMPPFPMGMPSNPMAMGMAMPSGMMNMQGMMAMQMNPNMNMGMGVSMPQQWLGVNGNGMYPNMNGMNLNNGMNSNMNGMNMPNFPPMTNGNGNAMMYPNSNGHSQYPNQNGNHNGNQAFNVNPNQHQNRPQNFNNNPHFNNQTQNQRQNFQAPMGPKGMNSNDNGNGNGPAFPNQQQQLSTADSPYMRQPVNPNRAFGRQKRTRPTDYREL